MKIFIISNFKNKYLCNSKDFYKNIYNIINRSIKNNIINLIYGYYDYNNVYIKDIIEINNNKIYILPINNQIKKIVLNNFKNAKVYMNKYANYGDSLDELTGDINLYNGSITNWSTFMYSDPMGIKFPNFQDKYINNDITKEKYGPTISRKWDFIEQYDNPEWLMRDTR